MCVCRPEVKTPYCGAPGCEWPGSHPEGARVAARPVRGTWKVDAKTGELVEQASADSYADKVERERRTLALQSVRRSPVS